MPADSATTKRKTTKATSEVSPDDHRKRRRNRTTQSCLNCHTTKRMCDRKRPCSRCTQLGLTGLCVYEVDNPSGKSKDQDERSRLQTRIAELEGVIRKLKNKPHPRGGASETNLLNSAVRSPASPSPSNSNAALHPPIGDTAWADILNWEPSESSPSSSSNTHSLPSTPSPLLVSASRSHDLLPDQPWNYPAPAHDPRTPVLCNCLNELVCYTTTLELASELRRVSAILSRSLNHCFGAPCALSTKIRELESLVVHALQDTTQLAWKALDITPAVRVHACRPSPDLRLREQPVEIASWDVWDEDTGLPAYDNSFMNWIPPSSSPPKLYP
ncbi:hypothetical protein MSAN_00035100 [Mycena sanguinolenta]|uniref:Zn(2)-C6 fungal-type domain-containing protein n=1 Tax=Mycena sanguinolenta TaxID=230812 RepID=A0A8H6ZBV5_9AGAR|nr:hypothetical protein MSAN_00035100 [Mycena sanguinolenta]